MDVKKDLKHSDILMAFFQVHARFLQEIDSALSAHGMSFSQFQILYWLDEAPMNRMSRIDLAEKIGMTASGVTRLLKPMTKFGVVMGDDSGRDARERRVKLTSSGKRIFGESMVSFEETAKMLFSGLAPKDLLKLWKLENRLSV